MEKIILSKKTLIILIIILLVFLIGIIFYIYKLLNQNNIDSPSDYAVVYLQNGEVYFGKIDWFPWPSLKNVWYLQRTVDSQNQFQLGVLQFKNMFWSPIDKIYLNPKQIIFWSYLKKSSELVKAFENPQILNQNFLNQQNTDDIINNKELNQTSIKQGQ